MVRLRSNIIPGGYKCTWKVLLISLPVRGANTISCYGIQTWSRASKQEVLFDKDPACY